MKTRYQNSVCRPGVLHKFIQVGLSTIGSLERCQRCGVQIHFPISIPNHIYVSYHIRSILQSNDNLFKKEFPKAI